MFFIKTSRSFGPESLVICATNSKTVILLESALFIFGQPRKSWLIGWSRQKTAFLRLGKYSVVRGSYVT
jgi:hypothetical protein